MLVINTPAQDSLVTYDEGAYQFKCPASWQRDNRGADPLLYFPDTSGAIDRSTYFSIIDEAIDEEESLDDFVANHFELSVEVWGSYGSSLELVHDTTIAYNSMKFKRLFLYLEDLDQTKAQWFLKAGPIIYIFELTATGHQGSRFLRDIQAVLRSFRLIQR